MKIDKLLEIIIYLLNHEKVSASVLAERFHVTVRTIQRDMVCITEAGIPVYSNHGKDGGYSILPSYKMKNCEIRRDEQQMIRQALESLASSYANETLAGLIEKYHAVSENTERQRTFFDFGIAKENQKVQQDNQILEKAIAEERLVTFTYRDAKGQESKRLVQPLAIQYKWYSWYLFAWSVPQEAYRTFKIARISEMQVTPRHADKKHEDVELLIKQADEAYSDTCVTIEVHFDRKVKSIIEEYFPDSEMEELDGEILRVWIRVPPRERLWRALLLSLGDQVKVVSPENYRNELIETAQNFLSNYDIQLSHTCDQMLKKRKDKKDE